MSEATGEGAGEDGWPRLRAELLLLRAWLSTLAELLAAADAEGTSGAAELAAEALAAAERFDRALWRFERPGRNLRSAPPRRR